MIKFLAKNKENEIVDSAFTPFRFPAGEVHTKVVENHELEPVQIAILQFSERSMSEDLFQLAMWSNAIVHSAYQSKTRSKIVVLIPYFPAARADRGIPLGVEVYTDFIYNLMVDQVILYDPHSEVVLEHLGFDPGVKVTPVYPHELFTTQEVKKILSTSYAGIIAPDKGAVQRAGAVARELLLPIYFGTKKRNPDTGKLSEFHFEDDLDEEATYLIVDDICDGGGTFMGLADAIREEYPSVALDLYVSHGVFSGNAIKNLPKSFGKVYSTNSYLTPAALEDTEAVFQPIDVINLLLKKIAF